MKAGVTTDRMQRGIAMSAGQWASITDSRAMIYSSAADEDSITCNLRSSAGVGLWSAAGILGRMGRDVYF